MTTKLLANQLQSILADPVEGFTVELADESSLYEWRVYIEGPKETCYEGGVFQLSLSFPKDYPMNPPVLKFISDFWHPNVYLDGKVCMSILHPPGDDAMSGELARERWLPTQSVTTIVLSLLSLLNDPNCSSPANVDASVEWRKNRQAYIQKCKKLVERANREKPPHVVIPHPDTDENQHRKIVQKWKELNTGMDAAEFYEDDGGENEDSESESDSDSENEDEDDLVESDGEIDSEGEGEKKEETKEEKKKDGAETAKTKESDPVTVTSTSTTLPTSSSDHSVPPSIPLPSSSSSTQVPLPSSSSSTQVPLSSSSSQPPAPSPIPLSSSSSSSRPPSAVIAEEISAEPAGPSGPNPSSSGPNPGPNPNNNNNEVPPAAPSGKKAKKEKGKKKKCIIM
eukprot:Phypoly_transcript_09408.p1 GENE.Phypoly_transcript_09408~~Phypoly_transcript_09408.p1  ORF type:complete len:397 (+),score=135.30 Phypoly_transcript_09408:186-1376(+)